MLSSYDAALGHKWLGNFSLLSKFSFWLSGWSMLVKFRRPEWGGLSGPFSVRVRPSCIPRPHHNPNPMEGLGWEVGGTSIWGDFRWLSIWSNSILLGWLQGLGARGRWKIRWFSSFLCGRFQLALGIRGWTLAPWNVGCLRAQASLTFTWDCWKRRSTSTVC